MRSRLPSATQFPFRHDNRRRDGLWDAPDATEDSIKGTSVDPYDPVWPRWRQAPPHTARESSSAMSRSSTSTRSRRRAKFYPPGRAAGGHEPRRQSSEPSKNWRHPQRQSMATATAGRAWGQLRWLAAGTHVSESRSSAGARRASTAESGRHMAGTGSNRGEHQRDQRRPDKPVWPRLDGRTTSRR